VVMKVVVVVLVVVVFGIRVILGQLHYNTLFS